MIVAVGVDSDACGRLLLAYSDGDRRASEIIERDDGFIDASGGPAGYFAPVRRWPAAERRGLRFVRGRVLDLGCGAGRVALELQRRGHEVVAIDNSPGAIEVARRRGVRDARAVALEAFDPELGRFDTAVMYGNNLGLLGSQAKARRVLTRLGPMVHRIVASTMNPYGTDDPVHLAYHARNRKRGRMSGQLRLRVRFRGHASRWFDYLLVSPEELQTLIEGTGWQLLHFIAGEPIDVVVLERLAR